MSLPLLPVHTDMRPREPAGEPHNDFYGLPSFPISIYHTGPKWPLPSGPEAYRVPKEARPVCNHPIAPVWHELGTKIYEYFDSVGLKWTTIDPVRFSEAEKEPGPLFIWVGVMPKTLTRDDAKVAAVRCKEMLAEYDIVDVEIAFRESVYTRSVFTQSVYTQYGGPKLLDYTHILDPMAGIRGPFTPALGLRIASRAIPHNEGTGGLYLLEGGESDRVLLLTARHVVVPPSKYPNELYNRKVNKGPWRQVIHLGSKGYQDALETIMDKMHRVTIECYQDEIDRLGEAVKGEDASITTRRKAYEENLAREEASRESVVEFYCNVTKLWSLERHRVLGYVVYAPPISVDTSDKRFTEDWAVVQLYPEKFDHWKDFRGNVIHTGSKFSIGEFMMKMYPDRETRNKFKYPHDGLMQLRDFVRDGELRHSTMPDANGEECIIVLKNGAGTGETFGRVSGIESFVRNYDEHGIESTCMEIGIYSYSHKDGAFSGPGDSGCVIGEGNGRIVGMLTGGAGDCEYFDVSYATPYYFLHERIKKAFPNYQLYPTPA